jgi:hypothetical protein
MTNILTAAEAAGALRVASTDANMLVLLPLVDDYIKDATGRDWTLDSTIQPKAKAAAIMLLVQWYENPAMQASGLADLTHGLNAVLMQLEVKARQLAASGIPDESLAIAASNPLDGSADVSITVHPVVIFNHEMATGATTAVSLKDSDGNTVSATKALDVTKKILTLTPTASLAAGTTYTLEIDAAADVYGATFTDDLTFTTVAA